MIVCSFVYGGSKTKDKTEADTKTDIKKLEKLSSTPPSAAGPSQNLTPGSSMAVVWPPSSNTRPDLRDDPPHTGIDLTRG